jgi:ribosomal protein S18 acetylase RimI-like enzyme
MNSLMITRVAAGEWCALEGDRVLGRADAATRPDGRLFVSIDSWRDDVFDQLARVMLADLPQPLHTVVDETDRDLAEHWRRVGFTTRRREWEYTVPTDPAVTGLAAAVVPAGITLVPLGAARLDPLRAVDRVIRAEVEAGVGWRDMPAEVLPRPAGVTVLNPAAYAAAARGDEYVGFLRLGPRSRQPRIGLVAVRADEQRRGVARALLAHVLGALHQSGVAAANAEVTESNPAATALFDGIGARRTGSNLELVRP